MSNSSGRGVGNVLGISALVLWGSSVALQRSLREHLGVVGAAGAVYLVAGILAALYLTVRREALRSILRLPVRHLVVCGGLFVLYVPCYYMAVGLPTGRQQAVEAGIINYLWTAATVVFSIPVLGKRARWTLLPGVALALAGVVMVLLPREWSPESFLSNLRGNCWPYLLALAAALDWGLYSTLTRRWAPPGAPSAVPLFLVVAGLVMGGLWLVLPGPDAHWPWPARTVGELAFMGVAVTSLGYVFWDLAMRRGNIVLVASLSYLSPLLAAVIAVLYLGVKPAPWLWAGCGLIVLGAALCRCSVVDGDDESFHHQDTKPPSGA